MSVEKGKKKQTKNMKVKKLADQESKAYFVELLG